MSSLLLSGFLLALCPAFASSCGPAHVATGFEAGPPSPAIDGVYYQTRDGYAWVEGRSEWTGSHGVCLPGSWVILPGSVYIQGYPEATSGADGMLRPGAPAFPRGAGDRSQHFPQHSSHQAIPKTQCL